MAATISSAAVLPLVTRASANRRLRVDALRAAQLGSSRGVFSVGSSPVAAAQAAASHSRSAVAASASRRLSVNAAAATSAVRIIIQGRKIEVTPAIQAYCEEKVTKAIGHFEGQIKEVDVKLSVRGGDAGVGARAQRTELTVYTLRHGVVRAEDVEDNLYASIDLVCDKVTRKLRKLKEKAVDRGTWPGRGAASGPTLYEVLSSTEVVDDLELDRVAQLPKEVVREKFIDVEAMTVDDATERLESLDHDFYVFREVQSNTIQVVYRRKERGYGVLIPKN